MVCVTYLKPRWISGVLALDITSFAGFLAFSFTIAFVVRAFRPEWFSVGTRLDALSRWSVVTVLCMVVAAAATGLHGKIFPDPDTVAVENLESNLHVWAKYNSESLTNNPKPSFIFNYALRRVVDGQYQEVQIGRMRSKPDTLSIWALSKLDGDYVNYIRQANSQQREVIKESIADRLATRGVLYDLTNPYFLEVETQLKINRTLSEQTFLDGLNKIGDSLNLSLIGFRRGMEAAQALGKSKYSPKKDKERPRI